MKLSQLLEPEQILLPFSATDKWAAISAMPAALVKAGRLSQALEPAAVEALLARERSMTTGMEGGVAIPHAALDGIEALLAVLAVAPQGIPFDTLDGQPGRLLVGLLIPRAEKLLHIRTLAEVARLLSRASVRDKLLACTTPVEALATIRAEEG
jgi:mannitol/fructose-specific phosphotransferase system IIA component (Ntr-type)